MRWPIYLEPSTVLRVIWHQEADKEDDILEYDSSSSEYLDDESFSTNND